MGASRRRLQSGGCRTQTHSHEPAVARHRDLVVDVAQIIGSEGWVHDLHHVHLLVLVELALLLGG
eukprot:CAMPEP_0182522114 /NCGR_PEP_ID=MMETSP1323-20130603/8_1 /TAXON_ID=236787 /ORGANISM="Florenciella parvula, Strain RCC1693" /LENGTH=64 /DNA_ID=CAMNT_0024730161 /DNA_START=80 /DNA_END=271 /DNA_ORIENTATION=-